MKIGLKENEHVEFKESLSQLDKGIESLTAMLNRSNFGSVYFGIKDDGTICGVEIGEKTLQDVRHRIQELVFPQIIINLNTEVYGDREVIILSSNGTEIPYSCDGRYYIRNFASDEAAHPQLLRKMLEVGDCDLIKNFESPLQELTFDGFLNYNRSKGITILNDEKRFLNSKGFFDRNGCYNLMAFLLSDQSNVSIKVVKFNGLDKTSFSERTEYGYQCLLNSIDSVLNYFKSLNVTRIDVKDGIRQEIDLFDFESFREAWINACLHNRWAEMIPPYVFIFDDRIEIVSYGTIPFNLSKEDFYSGSSVPVNKTLKDIFISLGLAEQSGHGVPVIVSKYGKSAFDFGSCTMSVTLRFAYEPDFVAGRRNIENVISELTEKQFMILRNLNDNPKITQVELAERTGISLAGVKKIILKLQEFRLIERKGSKKDGEWAVKANISNKK